MRNIFDVFFSPINASLAFAITFVLIWLFFMWLLYRKNIYIRV
jgi:predicted acyltransferase